MQWKDWWGIVENFAEASKNSMKSSSKAISVIRYNAQHPLPVLLLFCLLTGQAVHLLPTQPHQSLSGWVIAVAAGVLCAVWGAFSLTRRLPEWGDGVFWWGIGCCLRLAYILRFPYMQMQHDVLTFDAGKGHAGYILYLFNNKHLPDFDVRDVWQFYHPPLHHLLCAGWMAAGNALRLSRAQIYESLQVLPFTYSCLLLAVFALLLRETELHGRAFAVPFAVMAVHPSQIILSGSLNNDMLSILFMSISLLLLIRWFRTPKTSTILLLALSVGLGLFTKLSAWMAVPAAAILFLRKLMETRQKTERLRLLGQFAGFGAVSVPIGLFWSVRNLLGWGVPPAYIPMLSAESGQYVGNHPIPERLLNFSPHQFAYIYNCYTIYGNTYNEYNPLIGLLKTAVFDEFVNTSCFPAVQGFGELLFWAQVLLAALTIRATFCVMYRETLSPARIALLVTYGTVLLCYVFFCLNYPHTCTQSFRYAVPTLYTSLCFDGLFLKSENRPGWCGTAISVLTGCFAGVSMLIYGVLLWI